MLCRAVLYLMCRSPTGKMSKFLGELQVGDAVAFKGPIPKYPYTPNSKKEIGMVAGGELRAAARRASAPLAGNTSCLSATGSGATPICQDCVGVGVVVSLTAMAAHCSAAVAHAAAAAVLRPHRPPAGTGITPMLQVADHILDNPADRTKVSLLFANVSEGDILLKVCGCGG